LPKSIDEIIVSLVIDEGGKEYREVKLFSLITTKEGNVCLGEIKINKLEENLKEFKINIEKKNIDKVLYENKTIYEKQEPSSKFLRISIVLSLILGGAIIFFRVNNRSIFKYANISLKRRGSK